MAQQQQPRHIVLMLPNQEKAITTTLEELGRQHERKIQNEVDAVRLFHKDVQIDFGFTRQHRRVILVVPVHGYEEDLMAQFGENQLASKILGHRVYGAVVAYRKSKHGNSKVDLQAHHLFKKDQ